MLIAASSDKSGTGLGEDTNQKIAGGSKDATSDPSATAIGYSSQLELPEVVNPISLTYIMLKKQKL
jgi:hypothetical protein